MFGTNVLCPTLFLARQYTQMDQTVFLLVIYIDSSIVYNTFTVNMHPKNGE